MFTIDQQHYYGRELSDGYTIYDNRMHLWPNGAGSITYISLEPNPLGYKARLTIVNAADDEIEITNYKSRAWALWNYADHTLDADELLNETAELLRMEDANND